MTMHDVAMRIEKINGLDAIAKPLGDTVKRLIPQGQLKDLLSGTWLGHQLHPLLTDIPIGSFTSASLLDLIGGRRAQHAANLLATVGVASALPTAAAGLADWSDTYGPGRRVGVVHAAANLVGVAFYAASISARRRGNRLSATALGLMGMGTMSIGGYLGGHLTLVRGVGVNRTFMEDPLPDWTAASTTDALGDGKPLLVDLDNVPTLMYRSAGLTYALRNRCTHAGGPLNEGEFDERSHDGPCVKCPWHQSVFRLKDGAVVHGPAAVPQPTFDVQVTGDKIMVRPR
jgi:nitrite reductase/ring-hydroxylating ferredoxin subunit